MANALELKAECIRNDITLGTLASRIGVNPATLHRKIKGDNEFNRNELMIIKEALQLDDARFMSIFF